MCGQSEVLATDDASTHRPSLPGIVPEYPVVGPHQPQPVTSTENSIRHVLGLASAPTGPLYLPPFVSYNPGSIGST